MKKVSIYTKRGDNGNTSLLGGRRVSKSAGIPSTIGEVDELSSRIGMLYAMANQGGHNFLLSLPHLRSIQSRLQDINTMLASPENKREKVIQNLPSFTQELEAQIDHWEEKLPKLTKFILPGVTTLDAQAQLCRTQTRKVERELVKIWELPEALLPYINRLSDYFFVLARLVCHLQQHEDAFYT